jgi:hypothetical protein
MQWRIEDTRKGRSGMDEAQIPERNLYGQASSFFDFSVKRVLISSDAYVICSNSFESWRLCGWPNNGYRQSNVLERTRVF